MVNVEGEGDLEVFEFKVYLSVVALRGSVPNQWVEDFKQVPLRLNDSNLWPATQELAPCTLFRPWANMVF